MRAATSTGFGFNSRLAVADYARPRPSANDVLVEVYASSVNPKDWKLNTNLNKLMPNLGDTIHPLVLGDDLAGMVVHKGSKVSALDIGDSVYGMSLNLRTGALAEFAVIDQKCVALKPKNLSYSESAGVPLAGLTALQALRLANVGNGWNVLIIGASGGVGTFAVQIARALGAKVTGVSSGRNQKLVQSLGADAVIDYTKENFLKSDARFDAVIDATAYHSLAKCSAIMSERGVYVTTVGDGRAILNYLRDRITHRRQQARAISVSPNTRDLDTLRSYIEGGQIKPIIDSQYDLDHFQRAYERSRTGRSVGKVIINIKQDAIMPQGMQPD